MEFNLDGIDLTSETAKADILAAVAKHVLGLKGKQSDLLGRLSTVKQENEEMSIKIATADEDQKVAVADTVDKYKLAVQERDDKISSMQLSFQEEKDGRTLSDAVNDFSTGLVDDPAGKMYMQSLFKNSVDIKEGVIVSKDTTKTIEELKLSLVTDKANAKYIKAEVGSGLGSQGSQGGFNTVKSLKEMTATEEAALANSDPVLYQSLLTK